MTPGRRRWRLVRSSLVVVFSIAGLVHLRREPGAMGWFPLLVFALSLAWALSRMGKGLSG